jgi:hypothetical protein
MTSFSERLHAADACQAAAYLELLVRFLHSFASSLAFPDMIVTPEGLELVAVEEEQAASCTHARCQSVQRGTPLTGRTMRYAMRNAMESSNVDSTVRMCAAGRARGSARQSDTDVCNVSAVSRRIWHGWQPA